MLVDNRVILKKKNIETYNILDEGEDSNSNIEILASKKGPNTLLVNFDNRQYLYHSKYDPIHEARSLLEKTIINNFEDNGHVLFIGTGLGYHIELLLDKYPGLSFSIFEPNAEVLNAFLSRVNLRKYKEDNIKEIFTSASQINNLDKFVDLFAKKTIIVELPITLQLYSTEVNNLHTILKDTLKQKKSSLGTDVAYQQRWMTNSIINFSEVVKSPNLFKDINSFLLQDRPVILVSAGPSLSYEIEKLRQIREEGRAYIFAVGSAVNALIEAKVIPDAFLSYDPTSLNAKVAERIKRQKLSIPLIFGSSIGYEVLENYPGKKVHFLTNQDSFSHHILGVDTTYTVPDATSIAVITLFILLKLKVHTIILVGQNLGFVKNKRYAEEINYDFVSNELGENEKNSQLFVESVNGEKIGTNESFLLMKRDIENIISSYNRSSEIINTTINGAQILGTTYMTMDDVIAQKLQSPNIVSDEWLLGKSNIDILQVKKNFKKIEDSFDEMLFSFKEAMKVQKEIIENYEKGMFSKLDSQFARFDRAFNKLEKSQFFSVIIGPVTRVQYKEFVKRSHEVKAAHLPRQKVEKFIDIFARYMRTILATIAYIQPAFKQLKDANIFNEKEHE